MTPEQVAKSGTEHALQSAVFCWSHLAETKLRFPELDTALMFAIPNGGARGDSAKSRAIRGGQLKAEGVKDGVPDIFLSVAKGGFFGFYIEMKVRGKKPSKNQIEFKELVEPRGYKWAYYDDWEKAVEAIIAYMQLQYTYPGYTFS
jgi:hypothetical protein